MPKKSAPERAGVILMVLGVLLIAAAAALLFYNNAQSEQAWEASATALVAVREKIVEAAAETEETVAAPAETEPEPVVEVDGAEYIGYLSVPVLELELPVQSDWDTDKLRVSPCRYYGRAATGDLVICAHNNRHFGKLKTLQQGDLVTFTDAAGTLYRYEVALVEILQPTQIEEMLTSEYPLTLYTCTYGGQSRVTVRCRRI